MFEKKRHFEQHLDGVRKLMLREPRGYPALCCNVVLPPTDKRAAAGFVIMEQTEYPPMSGSNLICTATALLETGYIAAVEPTTEFMLEAPAGLVGIIARVEAGRTKSITFHFLTVVGGGALFANPVEAALLGAPAHPDAHEIRAHAEAVADVLIAGIASAPPFRDPAVGE